MKYRTRSILTHTLTAVVALGVGGGIGAASADNSLEPVATVSPALAGTASPAPAVTRTVPGPTVTKTVKVKVKAKPLTPKVNGSHLTDNGWVVESVKLSGGVLGDWDGTMRITAPRDVEGAMITLTVLKPGTQDVLATLDGGVDRTKAGRTLTVTLLSDDDYKHVDKYDLDLQVSDF